MRDSHSFNREEQLLSISLYKFVLELRMSGTVFGNNTCVQNLLKTSLWTKQRGRPTVDTYVYTCRLSQSLCRHWESYCYSYILVMYVATAASAAPSVNLEQHGRTVTVESFARKFQIIFFLIWKKTTTKKFVEIEKHCRFLINTTTFTFCIFRVLQSVLHVHKCIISYYVLY